ncbi:hypothetical protein D039_3348B, partial [Vibrio parahaemolyticus EKP-028]
ITFNITNKIDSVGLRKHFCTAFN